MTHTQTDTDKHILTHIKRHVFFCKVSNQNGWSVLEDVVALKRTIKIMLRKILLWCVWCVDVAACCDCGAVWCLRIGEDSDCRPRSGWSWCGWYRRSGGGWICRRTWCWILEESSPQCAWRLKMPPKKRQDKQRQVMDVWSMMRGEIMALVAKYRPMASSSSICQHHSCPSPHRM